MTHQPDRWALVGRALERRIRELGMTKAEVIRVSGVSFKSLAAYLEGAPIVRPDKARGLARALRWPPDAIDRLLAGEDPATFDEPTPPPAAPAQQTPEYLALAAEVEELRTSLAELTEELRRVLGDDSTKRNRPSPPAEDD